MGPLEEVPFPLSRVPPGAQISSPGAGGSGSASSTGSGSAGAPATPRAYFEQLVLPGLLESCAGGCHEQGEYGFLAASASEDHYHVITHYKSGKFLVKNYLASRLVIRPGQDDHAAGNRWAKLPELKANVVTWLGMEAKVLKLGVVETEPVTPIGAVMIHLDALGDLLDDPRLAGAAVSFSGSVQGGGSVLELTGLTLYPVGGTAVRVADVGFRLHVPGDDPGNDRIDTTFPGEQTFATPSAIGNGTALLPGWSKGGVLSIRFKTVHTLIAAGDGSTHEPCVAPALFASALDHLPGDSDCHTAGLGYCAKKCHGGTDSAYATATMNLSSLLSSPKNLALACAITREYVLPGAPAASPLLSHSDPSTNSVHSGFAFCGASQGFADFSAWFAPWIVAEKVE